MRALLIAMMMPFDEQLGSPLAVFFRKLYPSAKLVLLRGTSCARSKPRALLVSDNPQSAWDQPGDGT